jgi:HEAT repeat protein
MAPDPFAALGPESGDELIRLLPLIRRQETLYAAATTLRRLKRRDSLPILIRRLDWSAMDYRFGAAYRALSEWSWEAIGPWTRGLASPNRRVRLNCARILTLQCPQQRYVKLPPLRPLMLRLSRSPETAMREVALQGLWLLAQHTHNWSMDSVHYVEGPYDPVATGGVIDLAFDSDPEIRRLAVGRLAFLLGITRDEDGFDVFRESKTVVGRIPEFLKSPDPLFRAAAVAVWRNHYGIHAIYPENDPNPLVRRAATFGPSQLGYVPRPLERQDLQNLPDLLRLVDNSNSRTRIEAAQRLRAITGYSRPARPEIRAALVRLSQDEEPSVRRASLDGLFWIAQRTHQDHAEYVIHYSAPPYDPVALRSVIRLSYDPAPEVYGPSRSHLAFLAHLLPRETDPFRRPDDATLAKAMADREPAVRAAAVALAFGSSRPMLGRRGMADDSSLVRYAARLGLRRSWPSMTGGEDAQKLATLKALLNDPRAPVRRDAVGALADAWQPSLIAALVPKLRDEDAEVRAAVSHAIRALRGDYLLLHS